MARRLSELLDTTLLDEMLEQRYVVTQRHPELPLTIYNYTAQTQFGKVWNDATRICRGLIVKDDGEVVARPFGKFFNLGEQDGVELPEGPVHVTDKLDGSLGILYPTGSGHAIATRGRFTSEQAVHATALWEQRYATAFQPNPAWTYHFEIIYPANRIVVDYDEMDDLILLGAVETATGCSIALADAAKGWPGPVVEEFPFTSLAEAVTAPVRANREGVVVHFLEADLRLKIKHDEYVRLHRILTGVSELRIWEQLSNGEDMGAWLEGVPDEFATFVTTTRARLMDEHAAMVDEINTHYSLLLEELPANWTRKQFADAVAQMRWPLARTMFLLLDGKPYDHLVWSLLRPSSHDPFFNKGTDFN